ncbi:MAG: hypothetical protein GC162_07245 [Planctomycetes bacterium]|nr:hypothetical protein [Planctomycetota bacterium]
MRQFLLVTLATLAITAAADAAVIFNVSDTTPNGTPGGSGTGTRTLSTSLGSVTAPPAMTAMTYTVTGLNLTSIGGTASESIAFKITYTQTGGTGVQFNSFGNISVTGNSDNNQINSGEKLFATLSLNSSTFAGPISLKFTSIIVGGVGAGEAWTIGHDGGTIAGNTASGNTYAVPASSFLSLTTAASTVNLQAFNVQVTASAAPVPTPAALPAGLALLSMTALRRRT